MIAGLLISVSGISVAASKVDEAAVNYNNGDYETSAKLYNEVLSENGSSSELYANLANAYFKLGDFGKAMLNYERSLKLDPSDSQVVNNRDFLALKISDMNKGNAGAKNVSVVADEPSFFSKLGDSLIGGHSSNVWAVWSVVFFVLLLGAAAMYLFCQGVLLRKIGFFGGVVLIPFCVVAMIFSFAAARRYESANLGVVTSFSVTLKNDPDASSSASSTPLVRGSKLEVLETEQISAKEKWYKVRLNSDFTGWINANDFELI